MPPIAVDSSSTAYQVGEIAGLVVVVGVAILVAGRALTRGFGGRRRLGAPASFSGEELGWPRAGTAAGPPTGARPAARRRRRDLAIGLVAVVVAGAYVVSSVERGILDPSPPGAWSTRDGVATRAGFIAGCSQGISARSSRCACDFARISASPPYDTPVGFRSLATQLQRYGVTHDRSVVPAAVLGAVRSCARR